MLRDQLTNRWNQLARNFHDGFTSIVERRLVFCDCFLL